MAVYTTIDDPTVYFNTKLYTGTAEENAVSGVGFQPDWVWFKNRNSGTHHTLFDAVRGANEVIYANLDAIQYTVTEELKSFDSDGFTVGTEGAENGDGNAIASWNWKANGAGATNEDGSINTIKTSASTASGFSIVNYTGTGSNATVGHGLGAVPKMIIVKSLETTQWWFTYHVSIGNTKHITLNTTNAESGASANYWNNTTPTSSVFSIGTDTSVNQSGKDYIAYCFAEVQGFSKISSFIGNASTDGSFIFTGFKPAFVLIKKTSATGDWFLLDNKRSASGGFNSLDLYLQPSNSDADTGSGTAQADFVSNGFKLRTASGTPNGSGASFIFMAFAESPFVSSSGIPTTAR